MAPNSTEPQSSVEEAAPCTLSKVELHDLRAAFDLFDAGGEGQIRARELADILQELVTDDNSGILSSKKDLKSIVETLQAMSEEETLSFDQFQQVLSEPNDPRDDMQKVFDQFDATGKGYIDVNDLKLVAGDLGETLSNEELQEMIGRASTTGKVTFEDFSNIMNKDLFA